ncbi:hypothetical protein [Chryseobacterium potabilaquae]|uniref:Uncharacterized protein n=1 Tax=Chryseobacterium potabilaquae TaxID=2675057 RepID=A0A6N4XBB9_9FLAO|nr:hypothetical protein [Chryseobacterium potabilaquae]CAA7197591.1 hypothetical protein CHRY9293_03658 [Chryseobacterium potabilaquae]
MQVSEILQFTFVLSIVLIPLFVNNSRKKKPFERKIADLQFQYADFFKEFPEFNTEDKTKLKNELLNISKNKAFHSHKEIYRKLTNLIFAY